MGLGGLGELVAAAAAAATATAATAAAVAVAVAAAAAAVLLAAILINNMTHIYIRMLQIAHTSTTR